MELNVMAGLVVVLYSRMLYSLSCMYSHSLSQSNWYQKYKKLKKKECFWHLVDYATGVIWQGDFK